jgi:uncharacterized membrane protein YjjP (DUF1212 family)
MRVSLRVGEVMLRSSVSVAEVQHAMRRMSHTLGLDRCDVSVTLDTITLCAWYGDEPVTIMRVVEIDEPRLDQLVAVDDLSRSIAAREVSIDDAYAELDTITERPHPAGSRSAFVAVSVSGAAWVVFARGGWLGALAAVIMTAAIAGLSRWQFRVNLAGGVFGAAVAGSIVVAVPYTMIWLGFPLNASTTIAGGLYPLLPGGALVAAVEDGIKGAPISSMAKTLQAVRQALALAVGVLGALAIVVALDLESEVRAGSTPREVAVVAAGVAIGSLAVARGLDLRTAGLSAALAMTAAMVPLQTTIQTWARPVSVFLAGAVIGLGAQVLARIRRVTPTIFSATAVYVLVPGYTIYVAMTSFARNEPAVGGELVVNALGQASAIAAGIAVGSILGAGWLRARVLSPRRIVTNRSRRRPE